MTQDEMFDFDLETTSLYVTTDSEAGSEEEGKAGFYTASGVIVGGFILVFSSPPQYALWYCVSSRNFPTPLPSATDKVWKITISRTSGIRVVVHCNFVEVLNVLLQDSMCSNGGWYSRWSQDVKKIDFHSPDTYKTFDLYASQPLMSPGTKY